MKARKQLPSQAYLHSILDYDQETGVFRWKRRADARPQWNGTYAGNVAGKINKCGYLTISINNVCFYGHRIAWKYMHGNDPSAEVDHKDGNPANNVFANLREATHADNIRNQKRHYGRVLPRGVSPGPGGFQARIYVNGTEIYLGSFRDVDEASAAYGIAAKKHFGEFARTEL